MNLKFDVKKVLSIGAAVVTGVVAVVNSLSDQKKALQFSMTQEKLHGTILSLTLYLALITMISSEMIIYYVIRTKKANTVSVQVKPVLSRLQSTLKVQWMLHTKSHTLNLY